MNTIKLLRWLFWNTAYRLCCWKPKTLQDHLWWAKGTIWPWFRPSVFYTEGINEWHVRWAPDRCTNYRQTIQCEVLYSIETGKPVGVDLYAEELVKPIVSGTKGAVSA